jgi:hypothetical protein
MTSTMWICKVCGLPIIVDDTYTKHRLGRLCKACYTAASNKMNREYKLKIKWGRTLGRMAGPCKPQFTGDVHDVDMEWQQPKVHYCPTCFERVVFPNVYCDSVCERNYKVAGNRVPLSTVAAWYKPGAMTRRTK